MAAVSKTRKCSEGLLVCRSAPLSRKLDTSPLPGRPRKVRRLDEIFDAVTRFLSNGFLEVPLRQYRTNRRTAPACRLFRHLAQKFLDLRQQRQEVVKKISKGAHCCTLFVRYSLNDIYCYHCQKTAYPRVLTNIREIVNRTSITDFRGTLYC